jgi:hypothetical protein
MAAMKIREQEEEGRNRIEGSECRKKKKKA